MRAKPSRRSPPHYRMVKRVRSDPCAISPTAHAWDPPSSTNKQHREPLPRPRYANAWTPQNVHVHPIIESVRQHHSSWHRIACDSGYSQLLPLRKEDHVSIYSLSCRIGVHGRWILIASSSETQAVMLALRPTRTGSAPVPVQANSCGPRTRSSAIGFSPAGLAVCASLALSIS